MKILTTPDRHINRFSVTVTPREMEILRHVIDFDDDDPLRYHIDSAVDYDDIVGEYDSWEDAAEAIIEASDYDILVESVFIREGDEYEIDDGEE